VAADGFRELSRHRNRTLSSALLSDVCAFLHDGKRAEALYNLLLPYQDRHLTARNNVYLGPGPRYLGVLAATMGLLDDAVQHFERAVKMSTAIGARPALAQAQCDLATTLLARHGAGERARARQLARQSLESAEELGMAALAAKARKMAGAPATPSGPAGLSPRETDVLRLLAAGKSSREVGAELVLTVRTVERHITNIYRKIGARNRAQATSFALEHRLVDRS
jgi:DNA-binding CsgD family transcriptional regulator